MFWKERPVAWVGSPTAIFERRADKKKERKMYHQRTRKESITIANTIFFVETSAVIFAKKNAECGIVRRIPVWPSAGGNMCISAESDFENNLCIFFQMCMFLDHILNQVRYLQKIYS